MTEPAGGVDGLTTGADEVLLVLAALRAAHCRTWVAGGWGVDVLVARVTRTHRDLDLAVPSSDLDAAIAALGELGYASETDWLPVRLELSRPGHGYVDLHPVTFDDQGNGVPAGLDGAVFRYPRDGFTQGGLNGWPVPCLSRALQLAFRRGYELRSVDRHDLALLRGL